MTRRRRTALASSAGLALLIAIAAVILFTRTSGSSSDPLAPTTVPPATSRFPSPPRGAVVFAREAAADALALALVPAAHGVTVQASVVGPAGAGVPGLRVGFAVAAGSHVAKATASACGAGCYHATLALPGRPTNVRVHVSGTPRAVSWNVALPATWPPVDASAIIARATRVWTHLRSLRYLDRLGSDETHVVVAQWQIVAPDRLAYQIEQGNKAIIVGLHRWDRPAGGDWQESPALRLHQPQPFWVTATDARVIGSGRFGGRAVWNITFFDPRTPAWFRVAIDKASSRTLDLQMVANAHFMHDTYRAFDAPIKIVPPAS
jgi:hypothetical protein